MDEAIQTISPETDKPDEAVFRGVTDEFAWYELSVMKSQAQKLSGRMSHLERVLKERYEEKHLYVKHLENTIVELQKRLDKVKE